MMALFFVKEMLKFINRLGYVKNVCIFVSNIKTNIIMSKVTKQMQREFWKHNINPITGWVVDRHTDESALAKRTYLDKYDYEDYTEEEEEEEIGEVAEGEDFQALMERLEYLTDFKEQ